MGLLFQDGLDNYNTLSQKYTVTGAPSIGSTDGRFGGGAFKLTGNVLQYIRRSVTVGDVFIVNTAFKITTMPAASVPVDIMQLHDGANGQISVRVNDTGVVTLVSLSGSGFTQQAGTLRATSSGSPLTTNVWYAFEIKTTIANSGSCTVKQDGVSIITFSGDTQATANATADTVLFGNSQNSGTVIALWDDIIIMDDAGSFMNDFIGDKRIYTVYPTAEGALVSPPDPPWTPSTGTDNSALVDETPPNEDTDYVMSNSPGDIDTYAMGDIPGGSTNIVAVCVVIRARKDDAGTRTLKAKVRSNGIDEDGANFNLASNYDFYSTPFYQDPGISVSDDWTAAAVNALEVGQELVL